MIVESGAVLTIANVGVHFPAAGCSAALTWSGTGREHGAVDPQAPRPSCYAEHHDTAHGTRFFVAELLFVVLTSACPIGHRPDDDSSSVAPAADPRRHCEPDRYRTFRFESRTFCQLPLPR